MHWQSRAYRYSTAQMHVDLSSPQHTSMGRIESVLVNLIDGESEYVRG